MCANTKRNTAAILIMPTCMVMINVVCMCFCESNQPPLIPKGLFDSISHFISLSFVRVTRLLYNLSRIFEF